MDRIVVSQSLAKVYLKESPSPNAGEIKRNASNLKFYFLVGSAKSFEEMLVRAQEALRIDPHDYVPVIYDDSFTIDHFIVLNLLAAFAWVASELTLKAVGRLMKGSGGQGIFSFGKSKFTKVDKNSKDKVSIL